jgi:hypothetical protein
MNTRTNVLEINHPHSKKQHIKNFSWQKGNPQSQTLGILVKSKKSFLDL